MDRLGRVKIPVRFLFLLLTQLGDSSSYSTPVTLVQEIGDVLVSGTGRHSQKKNIARGSKHFSTFFL